MNLHESTPRYQVIMCLSSFLGWICHSLLADRTWGRISKWGRSDCWTQSPLIGLKLQSSRSSMKVVAFSRLFWGNDECFLDLRSWRELSVLCWWYISQDLVIVWRAFHVHTRNRYIFWAPTNYLEDVNQVDIWFLAACLKSHAMKQCIYLNLHLALVGTIAQTLSEIVFCVWIRPQFSPSCFSGDGRYGGS